LFGRRVNHLHRQIAVVDARGLGAYAAFGTQKALSAELAVPAAVRGGRNQLRGLRSPAGRHHPGGIARIQAGQFYVLTALGGSVTFVFLTFTWKCLRPPPQSSRQPRPSYSGC
jgi:hypothetical protein